MSDLLLVLPLSRLFLQYYEKHQKVWATTAGAACTVGDIVRIRPQEEPQSDRVQHEVREVVFPVGRVVDPITGRRCRGTEYINESLRRFGPGNTSPPSSDKEQQA